MKLKVYILLFLTFGGFLQVFSQDKIDLLILKKKYGEALGLIDKEINAVESADLYFKKGLVYSKMQKYPEAVAALEKSVALNPSNVDFLEENAAIESATPAYLPEMYHHLGQIYGQQRKFEESIAALIKSNEMDPANPEILFEIATTYEEYNANKTLALNYYQIYLKRCGSLGRNFEYAQTRISKIKEDMFFEE